MEEDLPASASGQCDACVSLSIHNLEVTGESVSPVIRPRSKRKIAVYMLGRNRKKGDVENSSNGDASQNAAVDYSTEACYQGPPDSGDESRETSSIEDQDNERDGSLLDDDMNDHKDTEDASLLYGAAVNDYNCIIDESRECRFSLKEALHSGSCYSSELVDVEKDSETENGIAFPKAVNNEAILAVARVDVLDSINPIVLKDSVECTVDEAAHHVYLASNQEDNKCQNDEHPTLPEIDVTNGTIAPDVSDRSNCLHGCQSLCDLFEVNAPRFSEAIISAEPDLFVHNIKEKSETRLKTLELPLMSSDSCIDNPEWFQKELEIIRNLDKKLQQLDPSNGLSACSSQYMVPNGVTTAVLYLRYTQGGWSIIVGLSFGSSIIFNVHHCNPLLAVLLCALPEEESLVEELLLRPDFLDDEMMDHNSTASFVSMGFGVEGEEALRMAEIDEKLEQFIKIHSACGTPSLGCEY